MIVLEKLKAAESQIRTMLADGKSMNHIAREVKVARSYLSSFVQSLGLSTNRYHTKRDDPLKNHHQEIIDLYNSGVSSYKLTEQFKCGSSSITKVLQKYNIKTRYHYTLDNNWLDIIDSQEKSYFLGYFTA